MNDRIRVQRILGKVPEDIKKAFAKASDAPSDVLPAGKYTALVADGKYTVNKNDTPSYQVKFEILDPREFAGRTVWHDIWLTDSAFAKSRSKHQLKLLGITEPEQLDHSPPLDTVVNLSLGVKELDNELVVNRVTKFDVAKTGDARKIADILGDEEEEADAPFQ
jgi:hypothetical protein